MLQERLFGIDTWNLVRFGTFRSVNLNLVWFFRAPLRMPPFKPASACLFHAAFVFLILLPRAWLQYGGSTDPCEL
jgi:hypothetical protein